ncbi:transglutaminase family protein [Amphibiibacter pelophylacis]|uniref:Transglutaminase family protein n=1 Tax=Amphibiibacter pelophylacis TaxID=1799477 RepID=A0ACC6P1G2_9BURK
MTSAPDAPDTPPRAARYSVLHDTSYTYDGAVSLSQQVLHLTPRASPWQQTEALALDILPVPTWREDAQDAFGNPLTRLGFYAPHESLTIRSAMTVRLASRPLAQAYAGDMPWQTLRDRMAYSGHAPQEGDLQASRFLFESPHIRIKQELAAYAAPSFPPGQGVLLGAYDLMMRMFTGFIFDPQATTVSTPVMETLAARRGVCQDFAHLMIACLRSIGLPARYVSGYLLTHPPEGQPRLIGADASHAWVAVYLPGAPGGWVDLDPTNGLLPDLEHITLGWGRDFSDVSPQRGVILGGGRHEPLVAVTVTPLG